VAKDSPKKKVHRSPRKFKPGPPRKVVGGDGKVITTRTIKGKGWKDFVIYGRRRCRRCQARRSNGKQCAKPAVRGKAVCIMHGGHKKIGRLPIHGLYSERAKAEFREALQGRILEAEPLRALMESAMFSHTALMDRAVQYEAPEHFTRLMEVDATNQERLLKAFGVVTVPQITLLLSSITQLIKKHFGDQPDKMRAFVNEGKALIRDLHIEMNLEEKKE